jgi:hypothetical protein
MNGRRCIRILALLIMFAAGSDGSHLTTAHPGNDSSDYYVDVGFRIEHGFPWRAWKIYAVILLKSEDLSQSSPTGVSKSRLRSIEVAIGATDLFGIAAGIPNAAGWVNVVRVTPSGRGI